MYRQVQAAAPEVVPKTAGTSMTEGLGYSALCWDCNVMRSETAAPVSCDAAAECSPAVASYAPPVTSAVPAACGSLR